MVKMGIYKKEKRKLKNILKTPKGKAYQKRKRKEAQFKLNERDAMIEYYGEAY